MSSVPTIVGHERILAHLRDAVARDQLHHALLFEGPAGVGKATVARWLVLLANCTADGPRPCGTCSSCRTILAGNHPDILEVTSDPDKASPVIPVARIREVVRTAGFHRYAARKRFVVIDPAEAMQASAANALLKTLEEPPAGTHFVLIASRASALLPTVVSRCQRTRFGPVADEVLAPWLEARGVEQAARVAMMSQGCPGAALALAEGGAEGRLALRAELLATLRGDLKGVFDFTEELTKGGRQEWSPRVETLLELIEELLRDTVVTASAPERTLVHADLAPMLEQWAVALWPGGVVRCDDALRDTRRDLALYVSGKTTLDALLTRLATELGPARRASAA